MPSLLLLLIRALDSAAHNFMNVIVSLLLFFFLLYNNLQAGLLMHRCRAFRGVVTVWSAFLVREIYSDVSRSNKCDLIV